VKYLAGLFHGLAIGGIVGWYLNSHLAFNGSDSILAFPVGILLATAGTALGMRAQKGAGSTELRS
jgi:hypothetical protein